MFVRANLAAAAAILLLTLAPYAHAQDAPGDNSAPESPPAAPPAPAETKPQTAESMCLVIEAAARQHDLPLEFFARVIWQESRFRAEAVGPRTRGGDRAQGIAQFMPRTASERGLLDPFDPLQALPKSAEFLSELRAEFGNLGLAAAAYNAGPQRVRNYLAGSGGMPAETRSYVAAITGRPVDDWIGAKNTAPPPRPEGCRELIALVKHSPTPFVRELEQRIEATAAAPWGVQLAAGFSRDRVLASYGALASRYQKLLEGRDYSIIATRMLSRGTRPLYQVRVGANSRAAAEQFCGSFRRAGGACLVLRNRAI